MIVEERIYTMRPGGVPQYLTAWTAQGRGPQLRHLGQPLGVFTCEIGELNTLTYLWQYDSVDDRARRRAALSADVEFAAFRSTVRDLLIHQRTRLLTPVPVEPVTEDER